jgi:hypothetical protein
MTKTFNNTVNVQSMMDESTTFSTAFTIFLLEKEVRAIQNKWAIHERTNPTGE